MDIQNLEEDEEPNEVQDIREDTLGEAIKMVEFGKAPGKENITPEVIKYMAREGCDRLAKLMSDIIRKAKVLKN